jgi:nicotinamidase-related amidase
MGEKILIKALQEIMSHYQSQGMAGKIGFGKRPAVLVVDLQKGITDPQKPSGCNLDTVIDNTALLLDKAREKGIPIFFFTLAYQSSLVDGGLLVKKVPVLAGFLIGSENVELDPRLKRLADEPVVIKKYASCYHATYLASSLTALQVDTVIITGCITSGCIRATANDSIQYGFRPIIPRECVGDRSVIPHEVSLMDIQARCGDVLPLQDVLDYIDSIVNVNYNKKGVQ